MAAHGPRHELSLPVLRTGSLVFPADLASVPASTRTSYTRVEMSRPVTSAGPGADLDQDVDADPDDTPRIRPYTTQAIASPGRFVRITVDDPEGDDAVPDSQLQVAPETPTASPAEPAVPQSPQASITFLLVSGKRRTMLFEPETTVGRVKDLVWNSWPNDWQDERPPAPSYFRILYLGRILQDEDTLTHLKFPVHTPPTASPVSTIVHLSVRATPPPADDADKKKKGWGLVGDSETSDSMGCTCCIVC